MSDRGGAQGVCTMTPSTYALLCRGYLLEKNSFHLWVGRFKVDSLVDRARSPGYSTGLHATVNLEKAQPPGLLLKGYGYELRDGSSR